MFLKVTFLISLQIVRKSGPTMPKEDEPKGLIAPLKEQAALAAEVVSPANLAKSMTRMRMIRYLSRTSAVNRLKSIMAISPYFCGSSSCFSMTVSGINVYMSEQPLTVLSSSVNDFSLSTY